MDPQKNSEAHFYYDYSGLDRYLLKDMDPTELAEELDQIITHLVSYVSHADFPVNTFEQHYSTLRFLRNLFLNLRRNGSE